MDLNDFQALMNHKYMRSLVDAGEAVGLLAPQGCVTVQYDHNLF